MRLLRFDVNGLLGLRGSIDFSGGPVLIYGKTSRGVEHRDLIRYLLIKPKGGGKRYSEDLHLKREELIFEGEEESCKLYLSAGQKLYRISLLAKRGRGATTFVSVKCIGPVPHLQGPM